MKNNINFYRIIFIFIIIALIFIIMIISNQSNFNNKHFSIESYTIKAGDSLWSIGKKSIGNHGDIREWISSVKELNSISSNINPGDKINIYVYIG